MSIYAHIKRCLELSDRDIASAIGDRRLAKALLDQLAKVSKPGDGAPKLLLVFAKMASESGDWIDGALRIEMVGDADVTVIEVLTELGLGMHERVFPSFKMNVPLEEFERAVERVPHMIEPLAIVNKSGRRLVLTAASDEDDARPSMDPPSVEIADESLYGSAGDETVERAKKSPFVKIEPAPKRTSSKHPHAVRRPSGAPKVISPTTGKTLRPGPPSVEGAVKIARVKSGPPPLPADVARVEKRDSAKPAKKESVRPPKKASLRPPKKESVKPAARESAKPAARESAKPEAGTAKGRSQPPPSKPIVPKPPPLPRVEAKPAGAPIARVTLTKMAAQQRIGVKPAVEKRASKPPGRHSKPPPAKRAASKPPPKSERPPKAAAIARQAKAISEPPDEESIDMGWEEGD